MLRRILRFLRKVFRKQRKGRMIPIINIEVRRYKNDSVVIYPRVIIPESLANELERHLKGQAWVLFNPAATFVSVTLRQGVSPEQVRERILAFLLVNGGRWIFPRPSN